MFKFIGNSVSFVLQVVLVILAVLLFAYFDPFGLLSSTKLTLKDTPISVQSIREIGELVTAEYYGEVIDSHGKGIEEQEVLAKEKDSALIANLHEEFILALDDFAGDHPGIKPRKIVDQFHSDNPELVTNPFYYRYLYFLSNDNYAEKDRDKEISARKERKLLKGLWKEINERQALSKENISQFKSVQSTLTKKEEKLKQKKIKQNRLVLIGRGWIKAGFRFNNFNQNNFEYDKDNQHIHFIGFTPEILDSTINPWFIPEKGIRGFEIVTASGQARKNFQNLEYVKYRCISKLKNKAIRSGILEKAIRNAETNLKSFFSILLEEDIRQVTFHNNVLDYVTYEVLKDGIIEDDELLSIQYAIDSAIEDPLINQSSWAQFLKALNDNRIKISLSLADSFPVELLKKDSIHGIQYTGDSSSIILPFGPFLAEAYKISNDGFLTIKEKEAIQDWKRNLEGTLYTTNLFIQKWITFQVPILEDSSRSETIVSKIEKDAKIAFAILKLRVEEIQYLNPSFNKSGEKNQSQYIYKISDDSLWEEMWKTPVDSG